MTELENGPTVWKLVDPAKVDEGAIDPLLHVPGRELGKFSEEIELTNLSSVGTIHGLPGRLSISGDELAEVRKINYKQVDTKTGFYSLQRLEEEKEEYSGYRLPQDMVIIGRMRPYLNNTTVIDSDLVNDYTIVSDSEWLLFEPADGLIHYWSLILRSRQILRQFSITRGQTRPRLHREELQKVSVPKLPESEKSKLNAKRREQFQGLQRLEEQVTETSEDIETKLG